jgi:hypothetical protein
LVDGLDPPLLKEGLEGEAGLEEVEGLVLLLPP